MQQLTRPPGQRAQEHPLLREVPHGLLMKPFVLFASMLYHLVAL